MKDSRKTLLLYLLCIYSYNTKLIHIIYAGRLSHEKSLPFLVRVMENEEVRKKAHLLFVGDGPIRNELKNKVFAHLSDCVSFYDGFMTPEELAVAYHFLLYSN